MRKSVWYQGFWKSAKIKSRMHGRAALEVADKMRGWGFHENALPCSVASVGQNPLDPRKVLSLRTTVSLPTTDIRFTEAYGN